MSAVAFELPAALEAREPPEARGLDRDAVKLMVARRRDGAISRASFRDLPALLEPGDLVVVNVSATLPAAVTARRRDGTRVRVHFATRVPRQDERWRVIELRSADGSRPVRARAGELISLGPGPGPGPGPGASPGRGPGAGAGADEAAGAELELVAPYAAGPRLMIARFDGSEPLEAYLERHGEPIRYGYVRRRWPLQAYQNVYAITPGSAEMPSAGRPFTFELITAMIARGVLLAPITLHTGVSSPERHEPPFPEYYDVPPATARQVSATRTWGGRVIAVGTTVARALETVAEPDGTVAAGSGWTSLVIAPERGLRVVDGLITGWHEPEASHLQLLAAVAGERLLERSYRAALEHGYLWHEFGDSHLILP